MFGEKPTGRTRVPVIKVPGGSNVVVRMRCKDVLGLHVHWLGRRSYVCPGDDCAACEQHVGSRWSGFVAVDLWRGNNSGIAFGLLELTEGAWSGLQFMRESVGHESILDLCVVAGRRRTRGALRFSLPEEDVSFGETRKAWRTEHIADAAATLYGLPPLRGDQKFATWEPLAKDAARRLVARALNSMEVAGARI